MAGTDPGHLTWHGLGLFAAVFALVWIAWFNGTLHHELHGHEDARGRSVFLLQILVLVPLGAFIPEAGGARGVAFAVTAGVLFAVLAMLWLLAARGDSPEFRRPSRLFVTGTAACALVLAASAALPADVRVLTWGLLAVAYLAGFAVMVGTATPVQAVALSVTDALTERFGLFIIIVLGETVTGVVDGLAHEPTNALTLAVGLVAVMVSLVEHAHDSRTPTATARVLCGGVRMPQSTPEDPHLFKYPARVYQRSGTTHPEPT
ncbi:low temperature requirement protein A [Streptomyces mirabilis]